MLYDYDYILERQHIVLVKFRRENPQNKYKLQQIYAKNTFSQKWTTYIYSTTD